MLLQLLGRARLDDLGSGVRIPLSLALLKAVSVRGFQVRDVATHEPLRSSGPTGELLELLASGLVVPHIGATFRPR